MSARRLLVTTALAVAVSGLAVPAAVADPTTPALDAATATPPVPPPDESLTTLTSAVETVTEPLHQALTTSPTAPSDGGDTLAGASVGPGPGGSSPGKVNLSDAPTVPALPSAPVTLPGGGSPPSAGAGRHDGSAGSGGTSGSPLGDDVLPAALEDELCTVLTTLIGPLPAEVKGLPAEVISRLPPQITDAVPADVLRVVTLHCPAPAPGPATAPAEQPAAAAADRSATRVMGTKTSSPRAAPTGASSLPHTGFVAGLPIAALTLLVLGTVLRRRVRPCGPPG